MLTGDAARIGIYSTNPSKVRTAVKGGRFAA
jgi:hypothetical protein